MSNTPLPLDRLREALAGRYAIEGEIGRGGMATVVRARDLRHDRTVAIKLLHPELSEALGAERFLREVRITARLSHPHILPLLDSGEADGLLYYVMPFVEGETLRDRLAREGELPLEDALRLVHEVADALGYAHGVGVVHRDIKPENILLQGGHAVVADFGIARAFDGPERLTLTGLAMGTPLYMSPEQASGAAGVDGRTDQYALACVAYELLTGEPPFTGPTPMAITARKLTEAVPPLRARRATAGAHVEAALARALQRSPSDRFRTMHEFSAALGPVTTGEVAAAATPRGRWRAVAALAAVALLAVAGWAAVASRATSAAGEVSSIAVLPFEDLSPDTSQGYFSVGLAEELVTSLSMVSGFRVAARTSTALLVGRGLDLREIAEQLDVGAVLEGSVRVAGNRIRVSTRLVDVRENRPIWSQVYERPADDVLRIQEEVATAIVTALRGRLRDENRTAVSSGTTDPDAYALFLRGATLRLTQTQRSLGESIELLEEALRLDPGFLRARTALASAYAVQGWYDYLPPSEAFPKAREHVEAALRVDPDNASALATKGYIALYYDWDLPAADATFRQAIAADSNHHQAHQWYANYLTVAQRWDEAEAAFRKALELEPVSPVRHAVQAWVVAYRGDYPRAVELYRKAAAYDSTYVTTFQWGAIALEGAGLLDEAVAALERVLAMSDGDAAPSRAQLARLLALRGETLRARRLLLEAINAEVVPAYDIAKAHLALGDRAQAMRWLTRAAEARSHSMLFLRIDPHLAALRGDPAFEALVRTVGL